MRVFQSAILSLAAITAPLSAQAFQGNLYYCGEAGDAELYVDFDLFDPAIARYYSIVPGDYSETLVSTELNAVPGMPNPVFAAGNVSLSMETDSATLNDTLESFSCTHVDRADMMAPPQAVRLADGNWLETPVGKPGKSWAGVLRAGPGMDYQRVTSLTLNQPVTLVARTEIDKDGYAWYRITLANGMTGYKWGGILCDPSGTETGTYNQDDCVG